MKHSMTHCFLKDGKQDILVFMRKFVMLKVCKCILLHVNYCQHLGAFSVSIRFQQLSTVYFNNKFNNEEFDKANK